MNQYIFISNNENMLKDIKEHANWILLLGFFLLIVGSLSIAFSVASTLLSVIFFGSILIASGAIEVLKAFSVKKISTFFLNLFLSILYIVVGMFIIAYPTINAINLTLLLALLFMLSGFFKMIFAFIKKLPHPFWIFLSGGLSLLLGILIWHQWPTSGLWVLGTFLGIDIIFTGLTWVMLGIAAKNA